MLAGLYASSRYSYLLFHSLAELFAIAIGCGIFMIGWNTRRFINNGYLMLLGVAYLFVAGLDLLHTLAYRGMPVFPGYEGANLATQLWVASRVLQSVSLVVAPLLLHRQVRAEVLFAAYTVVTLLMILSVFTGIFPACYVEGAGLTRFKITSEYVICAVLLVAIALLVRNRAAFDGQVLRWLVWSLVLTVAAEIAFTSYVNVYANTNLEGHFLKIVSSYLVYKAIVETGLTKPYALVHRELAHANENLEQQVRERTARYKEVIRELESLSYSIVHDMRGPLRAMQGHAQMLLQERADMSSQQEAEMLQRIMNASVRQDRLVQDVLSYMQVVRREIHVETVNLDDLLLESIAGDARLRAEREHITAPTPLGKAKGDGPGLVQCIAHLLNNAVKFVPKDTTPKVTVWTERNGHRVRLWVQDNGIGVPATHHSRIFKLFERLHTQAEYEGTGLGLAVVRKMTEQMGGRVGVESEPGKGSRFWIELDR